MKMRFNMRRRQKELKSQMSLTEKELIKISRNDSGKAFSQNVEKTEK